MVNYTSDQKRCSVCQSVYPATRQYFNKATETTLKALCKNCQSAIDRGHLVRVHPDTCPEGFKKCSKCQQYLAINGENFYPEKHGKHGVRGKCRACMLLEDAERRRNNPEKERARHQRSYNKNPEHQRSRKKKYWKTEAGQAVIRAAKVRRRARLNNLPANFTKADFRRMLDYWDNKCAFCGKSPDFWTVLSADHWIPISHPDCPGTVPTNMLPACHNHSGAPVGTPSCNRTKSAKDPEIWLVEAFGEIRAAKILNRIQDYFNWLGGNVK